MLDVTKNHDEIPQPSRNQMMQMFNNGTSVVPENLES